MKAKKDKIISFIQSVNEKNIDLKIYEINEQINFKIMIIELSRQGIFSLSAKKEMYEKLVDLLFISVCLEFIKDSLNEKKEFVTMF